MENSKFTSFRHYVSDLGRLLQQSAREVKQARELATNSQRDYETGRLMGYNEVISLMQQQAIAFALTLKDVSLDGIDPDHDLV